MTVGRSRRGAIRCRWPTCQVYRWGWRHIHRIVNGLGDKFRMKCIEAIGEYRIIATVSTSCIVARAAARGRYCPPARTGVRLRVTRVWSMTKGPVARLARPRHAPGVAPVHAPGAIIPVGPIIGSSKIVQSEAVARGQDVGECGASAAGP